MTYGSEAQRCTDRARAWTNRLGKAESLLTAIDREHALVDMALAKIAAARDAANPVAKLDEAYCYLISVGGLEDMDAKRCNEAAQLLVCAQEVSE